MFLFFGKKGDENEEIPKIIYGSHFVFKLRLPDSLLISFFCVLYSLVIYKSDLHVDTFIYLCGFCVWVNNKNTKKYRGSAMNRKRFVFMKRLTEETHTKKSRDIEKLELAAECFFCLAK